MIQVKQNVFERKPCSQCQGVRGNYGCSECDGWGETLSDRQELTARVAGVCIAVVLAVVLFFILRAAWVVKP